MITHSVSSSPSKPSTSRTLLVICGLLGIIAGSPLARLSAQTHFATLATDGVWTWYNDNRAIYQNGKLYFGYVRSDGKSALSVFNPQSSLTTNLWASGFTEIDDHNNPGLLAKQDGTLLAIYSRHITDQHFAYRLSNTSDPDTPSEWNAEQTIPSSGASMTYANPFQLSAESGKIYNFCRNLNFNPTVYTSTTGGSTWSTAQAFIQTGGGNVRPYLKYASNSTNRIDFLYTDGHPRNVDNSLYHMYYDGGSFYKTDGTLVRSYANLPILHDSGERGSVIYQYSAAAQADPNEWIPTGRAWCWETAYQADGKPVSVFTVQRDLVTGPTSGIDDRIYYYYARWTGTAWQKRFIAHAGRPLYVAEDDYAGGICVDPQNPNVIYISSNAQNPFNLADTTNIPLRANSRYELWRGVTSDGGLTFTWTQITNNSTSDNLRPYIPRRNGGEESLLWFRGTYTTYSNYSTSIVGLFSTVVTPQSLKWDPARTPATPSGGTGTWDLASSFWSDNGVSKLWTDTTGQTDIATFGGTAGTVTLGSNIAAKGLFFSTPGYALSGSTLTLGPSGIDASALDSGTTTISCNLTLATGQTWSSAAGSTLALATGTFTRNPGTTLDISGGGTVSSSMSGLANDASSGGGIVGPWASVSSISSNRYATLSMGNIIGYTGATQSTGTTTAWGGGIPSGGDGSINYDITAATGTLGVTGLLRNVNTIRYTGPGATQTSNTGGGSGGDIFSTNGIMNAGSGTLTIGGGANGLNILIGASKELVVATMTADVSLVNIIKDNAGGVSALTKSGPNKLTLSGVNTYTGPTNINAGTLAYGASNVIGTGAVTVDGPAAILDLGASRTDTVGTVTVGGGSSITGTGTSALTSSGSFEMKSGSVTAILAGGVALNKTTPGTVTLSGGNTYSGGTAVTAGTLIAPFTSLGNASGVVFIASEATLSTSGSTAHTFTGAGNVIAASGATTTPTGNWSGFTGTYTHNSTVASSVFNATANTSASASYVIASTQGSLQGMIAAGSGDYTLQLGSLSGVANSMFRGGNLATGTTTLQVGNLGTNTEFQGIIQNGTTKTIALTKVGSGILTLSGINSYTGATAVTGGTLLVNGSTSATSAVSVTAGTLGGTGTVAGTISVASAATLAPGTAITIEDLATGPVTFVSGAILDVDMNTDSSTADKLIVTGNLDLGSATLAPANLGTADPASGAVFTIATYTGDLSGTFNGLAEAASVSIGGKNYTLKYADGGKNITLTAPTGSPFTLWAAAKGLTGEVGFENGPGDDPDGDGTNNLAEFAFNGNPLSGSDNGIVRHFSTDNELILTIAVRSGTPAFNGTPSPTATHDGVTYSIQGSTDLSGFTVGVSVVVPITTGLPDLAGSGYEYRSFSLDGSNGLAGKGFLRAVSTAP
jgi:autotransporter-associated beta strand protein